jgi:hypothetical protein
MTLLMSSAWPQLLQMKKSGLSRRAFIGPLHCEHERASVEAGCASGLGRGSYFALGSYFPHSTLTAA